MVRSKRTRKNGKKKLRISPSKLLLSILLCIIIGSSAAVFMSSSIDNWYTTLAKPTWTPPNWVFAPVWLTLFALMGVSIYLIWQHGRRNENITTAFILFCVQFAANIMWSFFFFGMESPIIAFADIILLWLLIATTIIAFYRISKPASYIMIPYIVWVTIAAALNYSVILLN
ncbi:MAG: TspO/MBR family protein [Candidatus Aenigmatarchaeota archaeon]